MHRLKSHIVHSIMWRLPSLLMSIVLLSPSILFHFDHHIVELYPEHSHLIQGESHTHSNRLNHFHENDSVVSVEVFMNMNSSFVSFGTSSRYMNDMRVKPQKETTISHYIVYDDIDEPIILFLHPELPPRKISFQV